MKSLEILMYISKGTTIEGCLPMSTLTFIPSNPFSNTFTELNTFTESNVFTKSNVFTESSTFTASLPSGANFTNTIIVMHSLLLTQTISVCNSTLSISFSISGITYIQTEVTYYAYTVFAYSFYHSFYISAFTVFYPNEDSHLCGVLYSRSLCCCGAARCCINKDSKQDAENIEQYDLEETNALSRGLSISHIEEDQFADDFNEDKFFKI